MLFAKDHTDNYKGEETMKKNFIKLISLLCVLCMLVAVFASCGGGITETESESKKETESNETESSETESNETESNETESNETESNETESNETESETESQTETDPETPRETIPVTYNTVIDGFTNGDWTLRFDPDNDDSGSVKVKQNVTIDDATGIVNATNGTRFEVNHKNTYDLSYGFELRVTFNWRNGPEVDSSDHRQNYWGNYSFIEVGDMVFKIYDAFHEYYNGAKPVSYEIYTGATFYDKEIIRFAEGGEDIPGKVVSADDKEADADLEAEYYSDAWGHNGTFSEDVYHYTNTTFVLSYDGYALTVAIANGEEVIDEWTLWDGEDVSEVPLDPNLFKDADVRFYSGWTGLYPVPEGKPVWSNISLSQATPVEA